MMKHLHYLGPEDSFSHEAAILVVSRYSVAPQLVPSTSVDALIRTIAADDTGSAIGLVPYYNFLEGVVQEHIDLIYQFGVEIFEGVRLPIRLAAGGYVNPVPAEQEIHSHPKALAQISNYLYENFQAAKTIAANSTSESALLVAKRKAGIAIASASALRHSGLPVLAQNVGNVVLNRSNFTDFMLVRHGKSRKVDDGADAENTFLAITPRLNRPGLLCDILGHFAAAGLDIAKIFSRPAIDALSDDLGEPQMFYLEVRCSPSDASLARCADAILRQFQDENQTQIIIRYLGGFTVGAPSSER